MSYNLKYTGKELESILDSVKDKVGKEAGKGLSSNDFTDEDKAKLDSLENYDDSELSRKLTELSAEVSGLSEKVDELGQPIFKAVYGETTYAEIKDAYEAGMVVHCDYNSNCYTLSAIHNDAIYFTFINQTISYRIRCGVDNSWSEQYYSLQYTGARTNVINESSTNDQYPSAKAVYDALQNVGGGEDTWQVLELNTADIPEDRILLDVGADKYITDVDIDLVFSTNTPIAEQKEFRLGFLNTTSSGYGNVIRQTLSSNNTSTISAKYIGECVSVKNFKVSRARSGWVGTSTNTINEQGNGSGWGVPYQITSIYPSVADAQNRRYLQIYNYFSKDTLVFAWVRIKYKTANV